MAEPAAAISYSDLLKDSGGDTSKAGAAWKRLCDATGAGGVYPGESASIDVTGTDPKVVSEALAGPKEPEKEDTKEESTDEGGNQ